jgi:hypothetical protein
MKMGCAIVALVERPRGTALNLHRKKGQNKMKIIGSNVGSLQDER